MEECETVTFSLLPLLCMLVGDACPKRSSHMLAKVDCLWRMNVDADDNGEVFLRNKYTAKRAGEFQRLLVLNFATAYSNNQDPSTTGRPIRPLDEIARQIPDEATIPSTSKCLSRLNR